MKRFVLMTVILFALALAWTDTALAQVPQAQGISTVVTMPSKQAKFLVDGLLYQGSASFLWPAGSKHTLQFANINKDGFQYTDTRTTRFLFGTWITDQNGLLQAANADTLSVTAGPSLSKITANIVVEHLVQVRFFEAGPVFPTSTAMCGAAANSEYFSPGVVFFAALCYNQNTELWIGEGQFHLQAAAYPGFVFLGWKAQGQFRDGEPGADFNLTGPATVVARFTSAKRVNFRTDPPGLRVRIDRAEIRTTEIEPCEPNNYLVPGAPKSQRAPCIGEFDFAPGSKHLIAGVSPQVDKIGRTWVLKNFSTGNQGEFVYTTPSEIFPEERITANYVRGVTLSFQTKPAGLKIRVNGRDNWPENYFVAAAGTEHELAAPAEQTDARGRKWVFKGWSNGGAASQKITIPESAIDTGVSVVAEYELLSQVTIRSNPAGAPVTVDGEPCATPCRVDRRDGIEVLVAALEMTQVSDSQRLDFASWSNGGERTQTVKVAGVDSQTLVVNYKIAYKLTVAGDPADGVRFTTEPTSPDGFFSADTLVSITAEERPGYKFRRWDIDSTSASRTVTVSMSRPRTVLARMEKLPFTPITGVRNAAGATPDEVVAPGSLVSIFGESLAAYYEAGPAGPILAQALAGASVTVGNRILPLLFVSPTQINAQLPRDLAPGEYELRVIRAATQDVVGQFKVVLRAPGLFSQTIDEQQFALARHDDGSLVTPQSPARAGEVITLLATGFGPYNLPALAGTSLPPSPNYRVESELSLELGTARPEILFAGGLAGQVGIDQIRFRVPAELQDGAGNLRVKVRMDERDSNTVILPVAVAASASTSAAAPAADAVQQQQPEQEQQ